MQPARPPPGWSAESANLAKGSFLAILSHEFRTRSTGCWPAPTSSTSTGRSTRRPELDGGARDEAT
ncbi:MAG TPA: hypothetical protein VM890_06140 [Longimicrobium sp.]|nr:hypothetical protein [Longimicrobium sp.]